MPLRHHIESIHWVGGDRPLLLVRGWLIPPAGRDIASVQLETGAQSHLGSFGLPRPDVAQAFPAEAGAAFSGFSILAPIENTTGDATLAILDAAGRSEIVTTISLARGIEPLDVWLAEPERARDSARDNRPGTPPVLFIGHDFACAGAQLLLLRELRWLKSHPDLAFELLLAVPRSATHRAGPNERRLLEDLHALGPVHFLSDATGAPENLRRIHSGCYRLLYANTATLGWLLPALRPFSCPVISHVHELGFWIERRSSLEIFARQRRLTHRFIACSSAVRDYLTGNAGVAGDRIEVIHACGSMTRAEDVRRRHTRDSVRSEWGIADSTFTIVACGTFDWRKGAEMFVPICVALRRHLAGRPFRALWIGDYGDPLTRDQFTHEARLAGLDDAVFLIGHHPEPQQLMLAADCFMLPSREDPFPLVMLEAATLALPVIGFHGSGGVAEFVQDDAGLLVPYLDIEAFAAALATLARDPPRARQLGENARQRATSNFDEETSFRRTLALIESMANAGSAS